MKRIIFILMMAAWSVRAEEEAHGSCDHDHEAHDHDAHGHEAHTEPEVVLKSAAGGRIERMESFPAEVQVNRNRAASVSALYAGRVKKLYADIGDAVEADAPLADVEARETLSVYTVRSPVAGTVVSRKHVAGEAVGEEDVLFEVVDPSSVWVEVHIYPRWRDSVRPGTQVLLTDMDHQQARTALDFVSPVVDSTTRTIKARCVMERSGAAFAPGSFVRARIAVEAVDAAVRVEADAVQTIDGESVVFVEDEHGIEPRDVTVGLSDGTFTEIRAGLKPGERYVAHGAFSLKADLVTRGIDPHAGHGH